MEELDYLFKVVLMGNVGVGKTSILFRYTCGGFRDNYWPISGVDFLTKKEIVDNKELSMHVWHQNDGDQFGGISQDYYRNTSAIILIYDITSRCSFTSLEFLINEIEANCEQNITFILVGNKCDIEEKREVSYEEGKKFAEEYNFQFYETSAKKDINIQSLFYDLAINLKAKSDENLMPQNWFKASKGIKLNNQAIVNSGYLDRNSCSI